MVDSQHYFTTMPTLRCCAPRDAFNGESCCRLAEWMRPELTWDRAGLFCHEHKGPDDRPVAGDLPLRRVELHTRIWFTSVKSIASSAQYEALEQLHQAVALAGGLVNLIDTSSRIGLWRVSPPAPFHYGKPGDR